MRIISCTCRCMPLMVPKGKITRPIPDNVRQALFSSLGSEYGTAGELPELYVVDIFAGTGSFGLECLSRGAKLCCFVEKNHQAMSILRQNIRKCGFEGKCWIVSGSAYDCELPPAPESHGWAWLPGPALYQCRTQFVPKFRPRSADRYFRFQFTRRRRQSHSAASNFGKLRTLPG